MKQITPGFYLTILLLVLVSFQASTAAIIMVDTLVDELATNNNNCTLREAIAAANSDLAVDGCSAGTTGSDTIKFTDIGGIPLVERLPVITDSLEIIGHGVTKQFLFGWNSALTSGPLYNGILFVSSPSNEITVKIQDLAFSEGLNTNADNHPNRTGGCISVIGNANLILDHVRVTGCQSVNKGGGVYFGGSVTHPDLIIRWSSIDDNQSGITGGSLFSRGGGLYILSANTVIENSSVIDNFAGIPNSLIVTGGGLAAVNGSLTIESSTISGNAATGQYGGGLLLDTGSGGSLDVDIFNSTIHKNFAYVDHPPQPALSQGVGIALRGSGSSISFHLKNTIVANNLDELHNNVDDIYIKDNTAHTVTTGGTNWISEQPSYPPLTQGYQFPAGNPNTDLDYIHQGDPRLHPLADNGGPSKTELPDPGSSGVLAKGSCVGVTTDQRGYGNLASGNRPIPNSNGCDIGAVEVGAVNISPCTITYTLPSNQWRQIGIPCDPGSRNTVLDILGDEGLGNFGTEWGIFEYIPATNSYANLGLNDVLTPGTGYWISSSTSGSKTLEMPSGSTPPPTSVGACFGGGNQCFSLPLATQNTTPQWNMIGYPFSWANPLSETLVQTNAGTCASGCFLVDAQALGLVHNQLFTYNGSGYSVINAPNNLTPWTGYWGSTLEQADGTDPTLRIPKP